MVDENVSVWIGSLGSPDGSGQVIECLDPEGGLLPELRAFEWSGGPLDSERRRRLDEMLDNVLSRGHDVAPPRSGGLRRSAAA